MEFSRADETYLLDGRRRVGRSTEFYFWLSKRIPKMKLYYLFLEEIFPAAKPLVTAEAFKHAISIIRRAVARELEKSGRTLVGRSEIDDSAHSQGIAFISTFSKMD